MRERPAELLRARWAAGWAGRLRALRRPGLTGKTESQEDSGQRGQLAGSVTHRGLGRSSAAPPESPATVLGGCFWLEPGLRFEFRNGKKKTMSQLQATGREESRVSRGVSPGVPFGPYAGPCACSLRRAPPPERRCQAHPASRSTRCAGARGPHQADTANEPSPFKDLGGGGRGGTLSRHVAHRGPTVAACSFSSQAACWPVRAGTVSAAQSGPESCPPKSVC